MDPANQERSTRSWSIPIIFVVCTAIFTDDYIYSSIMPILPFLLKDRVGVDESQLQNWTSTLIAVYSVATIIGSPFVGWISDRPGLRKTVYIGGLLFTALSTVAFAMGRTIPVLLLGRVAQSLSGSIVRSAGMAMLKDSAPTKRQGRMMGYIAIPQTLGVLGGPVVSGWLYEKVSYAAVWIVVGAILLVDVIVRLFAAEPGTADRSSASNSADGVEQAAQDPSIETERQYEHTPLLPHEPEAKEPQNLLIAFFLDRRVLVALLLCFVQALLRNSLASTLPLFLSNTFHASSGKTGMFYLCLSIPFSISVFIGMLFDRYGAKAITAIGLAVGAPSFACLAYITHESPLQVAVLVILLLVIGTVNLLIGVPSMASCSTVASELEKAAKARGHPVSIGGRVFSAVRTTRALGQTVGPTIAAVLVNKTGWSGLTVVLGGTCAASFIAVILCT